MPKISKKEIQNILEQGRAERLAKYKKRKEAHVIACMDYNAGRKYEKEHQTQLQTPLQTALQPPLLNEEK